MPAGTPTRPEVTVRIERDSLGDVRVPRTALYGAQTQRAVDNFPISGLRPWRAFIWSMAHDQAGGGGGQPRPGPAGCRARAEAIVQAAQEVAAGKCDDQFVVDPFQAGAGTSHHMNVNEVLANRATQLLGGALGEYRVHPNDHVNMAQSTNDVIPTAIRLGCSGPAARAAGRGARVWPMRCAPRRPNSTRSSSPAAPTCRTPCPIRLGQEFGGYARAVERDAERIERAAEGCAGWGSAARPSGTGLNAHPEYRPASCGAWREITGLAAARRPATCSRACSRWPTWPTSRPACARWPLTLLRISNDIRLLASGPDDRAGRDPPARRAAGLAASCPARSTR